MFPNDQPDMDIEFRVPRWLLWLVHLGRPGPVAPRDPVETWAEYQARHRP